MHIPSSGRPHIGAAGRLLKMDGIIVITHRNDANRVRFEAEKSNYRAVSTEGLVQDDG